MHSTSQLWPVQFLISLTLNATECFLRPTKGRWQGSLGRAGGNSLQLCLSGHTIDRRIGVKSQRGLRGQVGKLAGTPSGLGWKLALNHKRSFGGRSVRRDGMKGKLRRVGNQGQWEKVKLSKKFGWSTNGPTTRVGKNSYRNTVSRER